MFEEEDPNKEEKPYQINFHSFSYSNPGYYLKVNDLIEYLNHEIDKYPGFQDLERMTLERVKEGIQTAHRQILGQNIIEEIETEEKVAKYLEEQRKLFDNLKDRWAANPDLTPQNPSLYDDIRKGSELFSDIAKQIISEDDLNNKTEIVFEDYNQSSLIIRRYWYDENGNIIYEDNPNKKKN